MHNTPITETEIADFISGKTDTIDVFTDSVESGRVTVPAVPADTSTQTDDIADTLAPPTPTAPPSRRRIRIGKAKAKASPKLKTTGLSPHATLLFARTMRSTKPPVADKPAARDIELSDRAAARAAAAKAVSAYYNGASLPFKAAADLRYKAPLNFSGADQPTKRNAAAIAAILAYCDIASDGQFIRGSGRVPGALIGRTGDDAKRTLAAGPESGTISGMLNREISYISGPLSGAGAETQLLRLNFDACESMLRTFNDKLSDGTRIFTASLRQLSSLRRKADKLPAPE